MAVAKNSSHEAAENRVVRLEELTMPALDALDRERTLIALPVSPIEEHGPHLPLGQDGFMARAMADAVLGELARRHPDWSLVRAPWLPIGCYTLDYPGSVEVPQAAVRDTVAAFGHALARHGFPRIVVFSAHGGPGHGIALEEACRQVSRRHGAQMVYPIGKLLDGLMRGAYAEAIEEALGRPLTFAERDALTRDFHAGALETSYALLRFPELVQGDPGELPPVHSTMVGMMRWYWGDRVGQPPGYMGTPELADPELGRALEEIVTREIVALAERMMAGEDVRKETASPLIHNPLFRTRATPVAHAMGAVGRAVGKRWSRR